jgi:predicted nucleic acid-binding Zn ribbon protein
VNRQVGDTTPPECPVCAAETKRVFTPVGVHFKGSGFYNTDYKGKSAAPAQSKSSDAPSCPASGGGGCDSCPAKAANE